MLKTLIDAVPRRRREDISDLTSRLTRIGNSDLDLPAKAREIVGTLLESGAALSVAENAGELAGVARARGGEIARRTRDAVVANPRRAGLGVGAAAATAVGIVVLTRMYERRKAGRLESGPDTPEELADALSAQDAGTDAADTDTLPA